MIDIEQQVINIVKNALSGSVEHIYSEYSASPSEFPCVMVQEIDNSMYINSQDASSFENHSEVSYQIDIYTTGTNKKFEAKRIAKLVDEALASKKFTRVSCRQVSNAYDDKIYRYVVLYSAIIGKDYYVYSIK